MGILNKGHFPFSLLWEIVDCIDTTLVYFHLVLQNNRPKGPNGHRTTVIKYNRKYSLIKSSFSVFISHNWTRSSDIVGNPGVLSVRIRPAVFTNRPSYRINYL